MRSDWLRGAFAWEYVNMVVMSRCLVFRALITQAQSWKRFGVQNLTSLLYLPIPSSAETWNIFTNKLCQFYFCLSWHFKREKSVFCKASSLQNKNWLRVHIFVYTTLRLVRISLFITSTLKSLAIRAIWLARSSVIYS